MKTNIIKLSIVFLCCSLFVVNNTFSQNTKATDTKKYAQELSDDVFAKSIQKGVVIIDFWATWCRPCLAQAPIFEETAKEMSTKVKFFKMDTDKTQKTATRLNIRSIPTLIIFKDGKEVNRLVGVTSKDALIKALNKAL